MEEELANLRILDEEEKAFQEEAAMVDRSYQFYLVGQCLTDSVVHFPYLRNTMADLWHPIRGICITDLGDKRYLFQFFHEVDMQRMLSSTPCWDTARVTVLFDFRLNQLILSLVGIYHCVQWCGDEVHWRVGGSVKLMDHSGTMRILKKENDPLINLEGKKQQRIVEGLLTLVGNNVEAGPFDLTASFSEQSNRMQ
ncbi:hypothetical protein PVK06_012254 [Gossypium arboreum]|uniref:DUF4283 domain-containing protein n=1 Tax=Gossypium arboreum TaxID=29729 RepID=A0ABR0QBR6_GOSAR|nr:hypothetical protein PVK06_012254 [Gossypium arboreum]